MNVYYDNRCFFPQYWTGQFLKEIQRILWRQEPIQDCVSLCSQTLTDRSCNGNVMIWYHRTLFYRNYHSIAYNLPSTVDLPPKYNLSLISQARLDLLQNISLYNLSSMVDLSPNITLCNVSSTGTSSGAELHQNTSLCNLWSTANLLSKCRAWMWTQRKTISDPGCYLR
jgi:hypothetical protein